MPENPRLHVVLFQPEIPQNTGNIGRTCAFTNLRLHIIRPMGFVITDKNLKRSGMDYWRALDVNYHDDWAAFRASPLGPKRLWLFSTKAQKTHWDARFEAGDGLLFGRESAGCPDWLHEEIGLEMSLTLARYSDNPLRSLNLSTAAGIAVYEALRQFERG